MHEHWREIGQHEGASRQCDIPGEDTSRSDREVADRIDQP